MKKIACAHVSMKSQKRKPSLSWFSLFDESSSRKDHALHLLCASSKVGVLFQQVASVLAIIVNLEAPHCAGSSSSLGHRAALPRHTCVLFATIGLLFSDVGGMSEVLESARYFVSALIGLLQRVASA